MVATGWASSGKHWTELFSRENSGTYNNQWMVLDATKVHIGAPLPSTDVLWIAEQVPGELLLLYFWPLKPLNYSIESPGQA